MTLIRDGFQSADLDVPVVLPTLNLDFANSQSLDERITFSRGSIGTFVNKNGLIETAAANIPRFDYDPVTGECKGLLIEESRTNLITNSNTDVEFSNGARPNTWTSGQLAPDGSSTAKLCVTNNRSFKEYISASVNNVVSTFSIYLKTNGSIVTRTFDLRDIASDTVRTTKTITITPNWQRFDITGTVQSNGIRVEITGGIFNIFAWGAQLEAGSFPTSYIPTSGSTVTRSADNASMTGTNFSSVFGSGTPSELSVFYSGLAPYASINGAYYWQLTNNAITERILYRYAGQPQLIPYVNGLAVAGGVFQSASQDINIKSVGLIDNKSFGIRANNGNPDYQFTNNLKLPRIPTGFQQLNIGSSHAGSNYLNGTIRKLAFYPKRLSSSQAVYLTQ